MRATAIVKILMANSEINPTQLTAAGRSEFLPLNAEDNKEAKAENRRTEIIISPKLDELFQMLENNLVFFFSGTLDTCLLDFRNPIPLGL